MKKRQCPTPTKKRYRDEIAAKTHLSRIQRHDERGAKTPIRAYRCACGAWHLTSRPAR